MRLTVFTSNQPRHVACLEALQQAGHEVTAVIEPKSWIYQGGSAVLTRYWGYVREAERQVFGAPRPITCPCYVLPMGELSHAPQVARLVMEADRHVVFGSSYITGALAEELIERRCLNLHLGIAPEYRGSAPNAWAAIDGNDHLIGAQVQRLSAKLDAGEILTEYHAHHTDPFYRGMMAARGGIDDLVGVLRCHPDIWMPIRPNDPAQQIRYARSADFTEAVAAAYLDRLGK